MKKIPGKRIAIAAVAAATLAGGAFAFADSLSVTSSSLGSGAQVVVSCQSTPVTVKYSAISYSSTISGEPAGTGGYNVTEVQLTDVSAACAGKSATIDVAGSSGASLGHATIASLSQDNTPAPVTTNKQSLNTPADANLIKNVSVVITG